MTDLRDKTLRNFYVRNYLFVIFDEMARDIGCSVDYLVNEAMRTYARSHRPSKALDEPSAKREFGTHSSQTSPMRGSSTEGPTLGGIKTLYLWFNDQRYTIDKNKYIIGRGGQSANCDLTIPDSNISRRHCAITYLNGEHIIKDLNSTNGIDFNGNKVPYKRIEEGDTFFLCDYQIRFTYNPSLMKF